jgi:hypothetical protein|tara:strand:+ start:673 stop:1830 length:1158 start_codon:yes stop_codon:yes gene_type:complete
MKKILIYSILTYLLFTINSNAINSSSDAKDLKIGILLPLSGPFQEIGQSLLKAIQLALFDIGNKKVKIYPKDSRGNPLNSYLAAKEFEEMGIKIVIGPVFFESLERLNEIKNITFISLTNKTQKIPKNTIAFGINIKSQLDTLIKYFNETELTRTLLLAPKSKYTEQVSIFNSSAIKFDKEFLYDSNPKKITNEIEKLTRYYERKKDLERRIKILENSNLDKDKDELKRLEQKHTLGRVNFDSVIVLDFGESLKSILTSFMFADVSNKEVNFFTINQWFDETLFNENAAQNLHFTGIDFDNYKKFQKKYFKTYNKDPNKLSILAYDALGLIYYCWLNNNSDFKVNQLYNREGFKGMHGDFFIENNLSMQKLKIYKISEKKFIKVY